VPYSFLGTQTSKDVIAEQVLLAPVYTAIIKRWIPYALTILFVLPVTRKVQHRRWL
jgi:hypothetical protein